MPLWGVALGGRMDLKISWAGPLQLTYQPDENALYGIALEDLPEKPGIYLFIREWGGVHHVLYVGRANKLKTRISQQLNNMKLMRGIEKAPNGVRLLSIGMYHPNKGAKIKIMLPMIERTLIRHYLDTGHSLLNIHGTNIVKHSITSDRNDLKELIPKTVYFEKRK